MLVCKKNPFSKEEKYIYINALHVIDPCGPDTLAKSLRSHRKFLSSALASDCLLPCLLMVISGYVNYYFFKLSVLIYDSCKFWLSTIQLNHSQNWET